MCRSAAFLLALLLVSVFAAGCCCGQPTRSAPVEGVPSGETPPPATVGGSSRSP